MADELDMQAEAKHPDKRQGLGITFSRFMVSRLGLPQGPAIFKKKPQMPIDKRPSTRQANT